MTTKDRSSVLATNSGTEWDKAWDVVSRLGAARKHLEHAASAPAHGASALEANGPVTAAASEHADHLPQPIGGSRPLHRSLAVWILIGALWISIGMIVSAAIVTVAYLA